MYVIDTNVLSATRQTKQVPQVSAWLRGKPETSLFMSAITSGEVERGIGQQRRRNPAFARDLQLWLDRTVLVFGDRILEFGAEDARILGHLSAEIGHAGADLMIAATVLRYGATVVTRNVDDFTRTGVTLENPFERHG